jgi:hypothetical protein
MAKAYEIQGATLEIDGVVYFIPTRELKAYRVPDAVAPEFRPALKVDAKGRTTPGGGTIAAVRAAFGYLPLDKQRYSGPFTSEDFITVSRLH